MGKMEEKKKSRREEREQRLEHKKESKKRQERILNSLVALIENVNKTTDPENADEMEGFAGFVQEESSVAGRMLAELIYSFTNEFQLGKMIKSGEIRKRVSDVELEWKPPTGYNMTHFDMENFSMKFLVFFTRPATALQRPKDRQSPKPHMQPWL